MLLKPDENEGSHLDRDLQSFADPDVERAMELLYRLMDMSFRCSHNCLEVEFHGARKSVQDLYWDCRRTLEKLQKCGGKADFLVLSVLEQTWDLARPLILLRLEDLLEKPDEGFDPVGWARELAGIFNENPFKNAWKERSDKYIDILEKMGFDSKKADFSDLTLIMDPLLSALSVYGQERPPEIYQIRDGARSSIPGFPTIANAICMYGSEKELADAAMSSGHEKLVLFGAVEQTNAQMKDYFYEWLHGFPEERQRNVMRNESLTEQEYLDAKCDYTRRVYLCVKDGGRCYLQNMPWRGDMYAGSIGDKKGEYYYGSRASYAPFQVFYKHDAPYAPDGATMLAIPKKGYLLTELLDAMSMAWLPIFLNEAVQYYFNSPEQPNANAKQALLPQEAAAAVPGRSGTGHDDKPEYAVVPVCSGTPAVCSYLYKIQEPGQIFRDEPWILELFRRFNITPGSMSKIPILPAMMGTKPAYDESIGRNVRVAYLKLLADRIMDLNQSRWEIRSECLEIFRRDRARILIQASNGEYEDFLEEIVDKRPMLNDDGSPRTTTSGRYPYEKIQSCQSTEAADASDHAKADNMAHSVIWNGPATRSKPPVVWKIMPSRPEHYAKLLDMPEQDLPEALKLSGLILKFNQYAASSLPDDTTNKYTALGYGRGDRRSTFLPCLLPVRICMGKKAHNASNRVKNPPRKEVSEHGPENTP